MMLRMCVLLTRLFLDRLKLLSIALSFEHMVSAFRLTGRAHTHLGARLIYEMRLDK